MAYTNIERLREINDRILSFKLEKDLLIDKAEGEGNYEQIKKELNVKLHIIAVGRTEVGAKSKAFEDKIKSTFFGRILSFIPGTSLYSSGQALDKSVLQLERQIKEFEEVLEKKSYLKAKIDKSTLNPIAVAATHPAPKEIPLTEDEARKKKIQAEEDAAKRERIRKQFEELKNKDKSLPKSRLERSKAVAFLKLEKKQEGHEVPRTKKQQAVKKSNGFLSFLFCGRKGASEKKHSHHENKRR